MGTEGLHRKQTVQDENGGHREKDSDAIKARKGVVKMLIASVIVYFLSYAPLQVPLFYDLISVKPFKHNWSFLVLILTLGYVNSAANPILYSIFSQNFRRQFHRVLCCCVSKGQDPRYMRTASNTRDNNRHIVRFSNSRLNTTVTSVSEI
jgi:thyrotropin-releasing hormone receptor